MDGTDLAEVTRPMSEPFPDVIQDLWQLSHVTASYVGRAAVGGILLATLPLRASTRPAHR